MAEHVTRIPIEEVGNVQLSHVHIIGAVGHGDDSHRYVELMSDLQHLPMGGTEEGDVANLLLVEVDDPNNPECLREAVEVLARHEHFEQRHHCFKQY